MFDGVRQTVGLGIAVAVILLLPIAFIAIRGVRKRSEERELQFLARKPPRGRDEPSRVNLAVPEPAIETLSPRSQAAPSEVPPKKLGFFRRLGYASAHLSDDRQTSGYSSVAPRRPDGSHSKIFFFNGNGRGR